MGEEDRLVEEIVMTSLLSIYLDATEWLLRSRLRRLWGVRG